jgi:hypothetical protein
VVKKVLDHKSYTAGQSNNPDWKEQQSSRSGGVSRNKKVTNSLDLRENSARFLLH